MAVSADDNAPGGGIVGFSASDELPDADERNPFWAFAGMPGRTSGSKLSLADETVEVRDQTATRLYASPVSSASGLDDVRVAPLVESKWDQLKVGSKNVYNYYTPYNWYCGCVATAMAQLMRFHRYPSTAAVQSFTCYTNSGSGSLPVTLAMKGGPYDWDSMPLVPSSSITSTQREAIGRICYDAGVAMHMEYNPNGSGAIGAFAHVPLMDVFGFKYATTYFSPDSIDSVPGDCIRPGILANLDAGYPVMLGIYGKSAGGHAILADGYGYLDGTLFCHLNMGWSGSSDYWYALPEIDSGSYYFSAVVAVIYNVFPDRTGELVTGRVADADGNPVADARIDAVMVSERKVRVSSFPSRYKYVYATNTASTVTGENGIYAIFAPTGATCQVTLKASKGLLRSTNIVAATVQDVTAPEVDLDSGSYSYPSGGFAIGNSWGNDFVLKPLPTRLIFR